ncbi:hypothetical protein NQ315_010754 [Exocentrus adspersus]|uniref:Telomerase reverse transcriptase n=1 Tax=Exocentrus adspersus TaxID=1586481 RepID=A0AAV8VVA7_9CUCU|nr:hypothetical protein NQ315_010754 [Exocentrus adspersus]
MAIYYQLTLDKRISKVWKKKRVCKNLKKKRRKGSFSQPVDCVLAGILERFRRVKALECVYKNYKIIKILDEVIGNDYFGTVQNRKRFYYIVNKISTQSRFECVYMSWLSKGFNMKAISWLHHKSSDKNECRQILQTTNVFVLRYVVKPLIKHFYHPLKNHKGYEIKFVERAKWHSFQHRVLNELVQNEFLVRETGQHRSRGELKFFPKTTCDALDYRPIIYPKRYDISTRYKFKRLSRNIERLSKTYSKIGNGSLFASWRKYCEETEGRDIYGTKLDIKDAFGYIDTDKLCVIIRKSNFDLSDKEFLINHIRHQHVTFHKKLYRWNHGLLQGDCLSSSLCNLFISCCEKEYLQEFCKAGCFLHRMVDDYFFCSVEKEDIDRFELKIRNIFQLNDAKTQKSVDNNCIISYFGQIFDLKSKQVSKYYSLKKECSFRHKFKLWNLKSPVPEPSRCCIILKALKFPYNNHCFKKIELNTIFNTEEKVLMNYFEGMVFIAFKFDVCVMAVRKFQEKASSMRLLMKILEVVVSEYSNISLHKIRQRKGSHFSNNITFMLLKNIAYRAFILVMKKRNEFYKDLIEEIRKNNLFLVLDKFNIDPRVFTSLPEPFKNVCMNRKSAI